MDPIRHTVTLSREEYMRKHFETIALMTDLPLNEVQIDTLCAFMVYDGPEAEVNRFSRNARKFVKELLQVKTSNLSNRLGKLIKAGYIIKDEFTELLSINKMFLPGKNMQGYQFIIKTVTPDGREKDQERDDSGSSEAVLEDEGVTRLS